MYKAYGGDTLNRKYFIYSFMFFSLLLVVIGCTQSNKKIATISVNKKSSYEQTFEDINLGILFDFDFFLPNADKRWVQLWVESYENGKQNPDNVIDLSYGLNPNKIEEGHLGFGIINSDENTQQLFLFAPNVKSMPQNIENLSSVITSWGYAIDKKKVHLELDKSYVLAGFRQTTKDYIKDYNFQNEKDVENMIKEDTRLLLLKIKIEAREE